MFRDNLVGAANEAGSVGFRGFGSILGLMCTKEEMDTSLLPEQKEKNKRKRMFMLISSGRSRSGRACRALEQVLNAT